MTTNRLYKQHGPRASLKGEEAARKKRERELTRQQEAAQRERDLKGVILHERAQHADAAMQAGVKATCLGFARQRGLLDADTTRLVNIVENARRTFRPSAEQRGFDPFKAIDEAMGHMKPQGHIARNQGALTREQRIAENETYAEKLKRLGLQNPAFPSIPSGITT